MNKKMTPLSQRPIEDLLQECLAGYEHGLTPEECLAPFASQRDELEPLFRNALSLRMAFTARRDEAHAARAKDRFMFAAGREVSQAMSAEPAPEFKQRARDRFMFAAGREVSQALSSEPDIEFKQETRQKLIYAAGAAAQEALRNVPPPKLPFWANTRRHLLEAAARPVQKPAHKPVGFGFNAGMSLAGIAAALVLAVGAFFYSQSAPTSVGAEYAAIEQQTIELQNQVTSGSAVSPSVLADLTRRTNELAARLQEQPTADVGDKLQPLIEKQREVLQATATVNSIKPPTDMDQLRAADQQLRQAEVRVQAAREASPVAASNSSSNSQAQPQPVAPPDTSTQQNQANPPANNSGSSSQPAQVATPATKAPVTAASNAPVAPPSIPGQVRVRATSADTYLGMSWVEVRTYNFRFMAPANWTVLGITSDANGIATANSIGFAGPDVNIIVNLTTGDFNGTVNGQALTHFQSIDPQVLFTLAGDKALILRHMVDSR